MGYLFNQLDHPFAGRRFFEGKNLHHRPMGFCCLRFSDARFSVLDFHPVILVTQVPRQLLCLPAEYF
jgi:hypothetical protein